MAAVLYLRYMGAVAARGPTIAPADRPRGGAFSSLLGRALTDDDALDALIFAYETLDAAARHRMIQAVAEDTPEPAPVLAALLSVETHSMLRARLEAALSRHVHLVVSATRWGDADEGGAALRRQLQGQEPETLTVSWKANEIEQIEILSRDEWSLGVTGIATEPARLVDELVPKVWRYIRRRRALPSGIERFAGILSWSSSREAPGGR